MLFAEELHEEGFKVLTSNDYTSFMDTVDQYRPDLLIFDVRKGNLKDLCLVSDIRKAGHNFPIIMCSSYPAYIEHSNIDYYIVKSADLGELKRKVKKAIETVREFPSRYSRNSGKEQQLHILGGYPLTGSTSQNIKENISHLI